MKNKFVAAALAFLFGSFGVHKFYLREGGAGIFYIMLFFMTSRFFPVSAFLGMIDGIRYLTMSEGEFDHKYNSARSDRKYKRKDRRKRRQREYYEYNPPTPRKKSNKRKIERRIKSNPFKKSGIKKYKEYDIEEAIIDFEKGLKLQPNDVSLHFNLACAFSLLENSEKAFHHIAKAVEFGFTDFAKIQNHDDLAYMRIQPEYDDFKKAGFKMVKETENEQEVTDELLLDKLKKLVEMRNRGIVTEADFRVEKEKILRKS